MEYKDKLKRMQDIFEESKNVPVQGSIPAGIYRCQLVSAKLAESLKSGNLMVQRQHLILDGEYENEVVFDQITLGHPVGMSIARAWFEQNGYEIDNPVMFEDACESITVKSPVYRAQVVYNKDNYLNLKTGSPEDDMNECMDENDNDDGDDIPRSIETSKLKKDLLAFCALKSPDVDIQFYTTMQGEDENRPIETCTENEIIETLRCFDYDDMFDELEDSERELLISIGAVGAPKKRGPKARTKTKKG